jgi:hypothetical protein
VPDGDEPKLSRAQQVKECHVPPRFEVADQANRGGDRQRRVDETLEEPAEIRGVVIETDGKARVRGRGKIDGRADRPVGGTCRQGRAAAVEVDDPWSDRGAELALQAACVGYELAGAGRSAGGHETQDRVTGEDAGLAGHDPVDVRCVVVIGRQRHPRLVLGGGPDLREAETTSVRGLRVVAQIPRQDPPLGAAGIVQGASKAPGATGGGPDPPERRQRADRTDHPTLLPGLAVRRRAPPGPPRA